LSGSANGAILKLIQREYKNLHRIWVEGGVGGMRQRGGRRLEWRAWVLAFGLAAFGLGVVMLDAWGLEAARPSQAARSAVGSGQESTQESQSSADNKTPVLPRGKKLILKGGNVQLVREYKIEGDRIRYYSLDSHDWEEIPAELVDWDATHKAEVEQAKRDEAMLAKVRNLERERTVDTMDIDASLEAAPGVFLPPDEGVYVFANKSVLLLTQADIDSKLDKGQVLKQVLVPIPIIPSRHSVSLRGTRAKLRITDSQPEFYVRTADAHEPQMELIHAKVSGYSRHLENIDTIFKKDSTKADTVPIQRWPIARGVYRFTLGEPLAPGEYALAEIVLEETTSIYVWDLGVDASGAPAPVAAAATAKTK